MRAVVSILILVLLAACASPPDQTATPTSAPQNFPLRSIGATDTREITPIEKNGTFLPRDESLGAYDAALTSNIQKRWYDLLEKSKFKTRDKGRITVQFRLELDGRVTDFKVTRNELNASMAQLCERAVLESAPFPPIPAAHLSTLENNYREVRFTFHLN